jgi:hypothetical protein
LLAGHLLQQFTVNLGIVRRMSPHRSSTHAVLLWSLFALFLFRVLAQLIQYVTPVIFLPPFERWQGSGLSYPVLLGSQIAILAVMGWGAVRIGCVGSRVRRATGVWLLVLGSLYFLSMGVRLILGCWRRVKTDHLCRLKIDQAFSGVAYSVTVDKSKRWRWF